MTTRGVVLGAICARGGSKGVPRKNLRTLAGQPLIAHTVACGLACPSLDALVVSTDDAEIAQVAQRFGAQVPFMRPDALAQDDSSKWDVFRHLVETWEQTTGRKVDVLVDLDTGVPLREPVDIEQCLALLRNTDADVVVTAYEPERNPYFNMVEQTSDGTVRVVKPLNSPVTNRQAAPAVFSLSPAVFAIRADALRRFSHWSQARMRVHVVPRERAVDIDTAFDFQLVEFLMESQRVHG
ncbi:MAG: acylneuraminate cytidylyltransferase family protein [Acidobacteria bacterium]|nr:acylneuraminate cytidylyltransferase family protein [Acidobacteriota bacterium]